jgi:hypothetical protein
VIANSPRLSAELNQSQIQRAYAQTNYQDNWSVNLKLEINLQEVILTLRDHPQRRVCQLYLEVYIYSARELKVSLSD